MFSSSCNKGLSVVELLIAVFLVMIGVMALITMQPQGWLLSGRSDFLGRAAEVLHEQLETSEAIIMNPCNTAMPTPWGATIPTTLNGSITNTATVRTSGMSSAQPGDLDLTVATTITCTSASPLLWRVTVVVTWPANTTGLRESTLVTRQEGFRQGC